MPGIFNRKDSEGEQGAGMFTRNERIALVIFFILALAYAILQFTGRETTQTGIALGEDIVIDGSMIVVQVEGAVVSPGLVSVHQGARIIDAVQAAGGFTDDADSSVAGSTEILSDGTRIYIPTLAESGKSGSEWDENNNRIRGIDYYDERTSGGRFDVVNINTADVPELVTLPGIGETLAIRIIDYRNMHGGFKSVDELLEVEGIGENKLDGIRARVTVGD